eukprot:3599689-Rhodomonas_salina.1
MLRVKAGDWKFCSVCSIVASARCRPRLGFRCSASPFLSLACKHGSRRQRGDCCEAAYNTTTD